VSRWIRTAPLGAVLFCWAGLCSAQPYLEELLARAERDRLAAEPGWAHLLHLEERALGPPRSTVRSAWFFLDAKGAEDPAAELRATLRAFFDPTERAPREESAQCIFGARYAWLRERLQFDPARLPPQACTRRAAWMQALRPDRIWAVFPSAYLNSPASMFGHTLLRLDGPEVRDGTPLLAYAANYVAETPETNGLVFAVKGLAGGYVGQYSVLPYYEKVKEYARLESRDLWEYPLDLDAAARERLLLHLWELRGAAFTYFFFTKNCSYQLLTLLRVADPRVDWGSAFAWWAIPTDTLRALEGLRGAPVFRPALATELRARADAVGPEGQRRADALARGTVAAAPDDGAAVLDLAQALLQYRLAESDLTPELARPRALALLRARAATGLRDEGLTIAPPAVEPTAGHATARGVLGLRSGKRQGEQLTLRWRPAYHDLLDPPGGYGSGQQLVFADLGLDLDLQDGSLRLDHLVAVDLVSVAHRDRLVRPISWRVRFAHERPDLGLGADPRITRLAGGPGLAWGRDGRWSLFAFAEVQAEAASARDRGHALQAGVRLGSLAHPAPRWTLLADALWLPAVAGDPADRRALHLGQQWSPTPALGLRLDARYLRLGRDEAASVELGLVRYF
jgi:hypothetical protein